MDNNMPKRKPMRRSGFDYNSVGAYFLTICTEKRRCVLSRVVGTGVLDCPKVKLTQYGQIAEKYISQIGEFYEHLNVVKYVIMPNHIHMILIVSEKGQSRTPVPTYANSAVSRFVSTFKRFTNKEYGANIWQGRFYDHIIRSKEDYEEHLKYIHENPMRWYYDELYAYE